MAMYPVTIGRLSMLVCWQLSIKWWKLSSYGWGLYGCKWPTICLGPLKIVTGPAPRRSCDD